MIGFIAEVLLFEEAVSDGGWSRRLHSKGGTVAGMREKAINHVSLKEEKRKGKNWGKKRKNGTKEERVRPISSR